VIYYETEENNNNNNNTNDNNNMGCYLKDIVHYLEGMEQGKKSEKINGTIRQSKI